LAQLPTVVLGVLIILLAVTLAVAGTALVHNRVPSKLRESHTVPLGLLNVGLTGMFSIIIGLTAISCWASTVTPSRRCKAKPET
jgi:uncharacterized membrane protein